MVAQFVALVEAGSLSSASRRLGVAKSNLSRSLSKLEKELGTQLIFRNTRNFRPTEAGLHFFELCRNPLFEIRNAGELIKKNEDDLRGKLTLTMAVDVALTIMPTVISDFAKTYPNIEIDIRAEDRIVDLIGEGVDLAIRAGKLTDSNLKSLKISDISLILVATPEYLLNHSRIKNFDQLNEHRIILFNRKFEKSLNVHKKSGQKSKVRLKSSMTLNNPLLAKDFALRGHGIALIPDVICSEDLRTGHLVRVLPDFSAESSALYYVWSPAASESSKLRAFIEFSRERLRKHFVAARDEK